MLLNLTDLSAEPLHSQVYRQIRSRILSGSLPEAAELPAASVLAREHRVSSSSVQRAYDELNGEGLVREGENESWRVAELSDENRQELARQRMFESLREQELSVKELELARDIQCRLLPPGRVEGGGYAVGSRNDPARFVAGDFYDVIRHADGTLGLVVADVAGKGLGPSLIMASVKAVMPFVSAGRLVNETLVELNKKLRRELRKREFVALQLGHFDPATGALSLCNAGMPDGYLLGAAGKPKAINVPGERLPLGLRDDPDYQSATIHLEIGDRFLMCSDGLPEANLPDGEPLGYERFERLLKRASGAEPDVWIDDLMERLRRKLPANHRRDDDWTALMIERRTGHAAVAR